MRPSGSRRARLRSAATALLAIAATAAGVATPSSATAQAAMPERSYCSDRPGLGTPPCTIAPGRISLETGMADWQRDRAGTAQVDAVLLGETAVRIGIGDAVELFAVGRPYGFVASRDATGRRPTVQGTGDVVAGVKVNLASPDGSGFSVAAMPFVTVPVGGRALGAGQWLAGLVVPMSFALDDLVSLQLTQQIGAAPDRDGAGRHSAYGLVAGIATALGRAASITHELAIGHDRDPDGRTTSTLYAASLAWMLRPDLQVDAGLVLGLDAASPDARFYVGIARLF